MKKLLFFVAMFSSIALTAKANSELSCGCGDIVEIKATPEEGFKFSHWDDGRTENPRQINVEKGAKLDYIAYFKPEQYKISFMCEGVELPASGMFDYMSPVTYTGATPEKKEDAQNYYKFSGWDPEITAKTTVPLGGATYTAQFDPILRYYEIQYKNYDGMVLFKDSFAYGTMPEYKRVDKPVKPATDQWSYQFKSWHKKEELVKGPDTYIATFDSTEIKYTVTFYDWDDKLIYSYDASLGDMAEYPKDKQRPTRTATKEYEYVFKGWTPQLGIVTKDESTRNYTAEYDQIKISYTITFLDGDGKQLTNTQTKFEYGVMPTYNGAEPTKQSTPEYDYKWDGTWTPAIALVTGDTVYKANFTPIKRQYKVEVTGTNGSFELIGPDGVKLNSGMFYYGDEVTIVPIADECYHFVHWVDNPNDTSTPRTITVGGPVTYSAVFAIDEYKVVVSVEPGKEHMGTVTIKLANP